MERAHAGAEILVRRRGKPYARLGPPDLKSSPVAADE
jgi:antitoxin (DNA-binding transcriptional repressor) of toxin-antitoxin stability system